MRIRSLLSAFLIVACCLPAFGQDTRQFRPPPLPDPNRNRDSLPYKLTNKLPAFNVLLRDSSTIFNSFYIPKGKPIALMFFSPDCKHCKETMGQLVKGMDSLKDVRLYLMAASFMLEPVRQFARDFELDKFKNIEVIGADYEIFFLDFFGTMRVPDLALYDENKKFVHLFEEHFTATDILNKLSNR